MIVRDIQALLESWAPKDIAWERDNIGLLIGAPENRANRILVALDVTDEVVEEALAKKIDLIISHHPLLFHPLKAVRSDRRTGRITTALIRHNIALYAAHTNLDFTQAGVSFALAERLKLHEVDFLSKEQEIYKKIVVFVPDEYIDKVTHAMAQAGAGVIGKYEQCSFRSRGTGTYTPTGDAKPFVGKPGGAETVSESRLEMILPKWKLEDVVKAMKMSHPYEEVAYDIYDLGNASNSYGAGAIGELNREMSTKAFLEQLTSLLDAGAIRYTENRNRKIKRVAVCGGSGSSLLDTAMHAGADAFVTADVSYHTFQEAEGRIALMDAGHYETEQPIVHKIVAYLKTYCKINATVAASARSRNPVHYHLS